MVGCGSSVMAGWWRLVDDDWLMTTGLGPIRTVELGRFYGAGARNWPQTPQLLADPRLLADSVFVRSRNPALSTSGGHDHMHPRLNGVFRAAAARTKGVPVA